MGQDVVSMMDADMKLGLMIEKKLLEAYKSNSVAITSSSVEND